MRAFGTHFVPERDAVRVVTDVQPLQSVEAAQEGKR
jgi:hypothetical protein